MEILLQYHDQVLQGITNDYRRFLHDKIDWKDRMIGVKGPRGSGKTTLLLQHLKYDLGNDFKKALYITADHTWFYNNTLLETAMLWSQRGGRYLFIDEVHKYARWSRELKNIYDGFPNLKIVFSSSSALDIYRGEADLSRRVISYELPGLSFREYLAFTGYGKWEAIPFKTLVKDHVEIARSFSEKGPFIPVFKTYLKYGYLPIIAEGESGYFTKLEQVINTILDTDLAYIASYNSGTSAKVKKILGVIAESVPFKPNISNLSRKLDVSRELIYESIQQLRDARLINLLHAKGQGISLLQKPEKIFLENTNLAYVFNAQPNTGNLRETFVLNQLLNSGLEVYSPDKGDFWVEDLYLEVGGASKTASQVKMVTNHLVLADDIETGIGQKVPIWLFGFLY